MKKLIALVLALAMVFAVAVASAATITINRDSSWNENAENADATYTPYKVFDATIISAASVNATTGALTSSTGNVVYTVDTSAKADAVNATGVLKAQLASDGLYYISKDGTPTDAQILTAIGTMVTGNPTVFTAGTAVTSDDAAVTLTVADDGYYYIAASNGKDAIVQTIGDVTINEKNDYPTIDKKQSETTSSYTNDAVAIEVGSYINYQVTVHVPTDATKAIKVFDTMSTGLEFDHPADPSDGDGLTVTPATATYSAIVSGETDYDSNATWQIKFADSVVQSLRGQDIVITYRAKVTDAAITDSSKENEVTLNYDNGNYILKDDVNYKIYFGGIYKVDPNDASANMAGVKFDLTSGGNDVKVTYDSTNGYYYVDPQGSDNEVETRAETVDTGNGTVTYYTIKIRGLDNDKTYTLTETETKTGYNLLNGTVTLTKTEDTGTAFSNKALNTFDLVENNKGTQLPSTGGIGTTIFYIVGGLLVVGAAVVMVARRKASN